jgi:HK97 family phage major capsid protein
MNSQEVIEITNKVGQAFEDFKDHHNQELAEVKKGIKSLEIGYGRMNAGAFGGGSSLTGDTIGNPEYSKNFDVWLRKGAGEESLRGMMPRGDMSTLSDPDGGFLVPEQLEKIIDRVAVDSCAMRRIATVKKGLRGDYKRPFSQGGAGVGWVGEIETRAETDTPTLTLFTPPWSEAYALLKATQVFFDDANSDVAAWLQDEIIKSELELEGTAFITGSGVKQPKGLLSYDAVADASWEWGKLGYIASGEATAFTNPDILFTLQHSLKGAYRRNGTWLMNSNTWEAIRKFQDGNGNYMWRPGLESGQPEILLGKPVEIDDNMPDIAANACPLAFGDFRRSYLIGDHAAGRRILRDPFTQKGFVLLYVTKRIFGGIINFEGVKLLKIASA